MFRTLIFGVIVLFLLSCVALLLNLLFWWKSSTLRKKKQDNNNHHHHYHNNVYICMHVSVDTSIHFLFISLLSITITSFYFFYCHTFIYVRRLPPHLLHVFFFLLSLPHTKQIYLYIYIYMYEYHFWILYAFFLMLMQLLFLLVKFKIYTKEKSHKKHSKITSWTIIKIILRAATI